MAGIGIITNPHSKLNKRNPKRQEILSYIAGERGQLKSTKTLEELSATAMEFKNKEIEILAINGGDGTISRTLSAFINAYGQTPLPTIAILGGGTINMLAQNLGIKGTPEQNLFRLMEMHSREDIKKFHPIDTLRVEDSYGFLFANGTSSYFLEEFYKNKTNANGSILLVCKIFLSYILKTALYKRLVRKEFFTLRPSKRDKISHGSVSILCSTVKKMPLGVPFFLNAQNDTGEFQCVSFTTDPKKFPLKFLIESFLRPFHYEKEKITLQCSQLEISSQQKIFYTLDGELYHSKTNSLQISLGPKLRLLQL